MCTTTICTDIHVCIYLRITCVRCASTTGRVVNAAVAATFRCSWTQLSAYGGTINIAQRVRRGAERNTYTRTYFTLRACARMRARGMRRTTRLLCVPSLGSRLGSRQAEISFTATTEGREMGKNETHGRVQRFGNLGTLYARHAPADSHEDSSNVKEMNGHRSPKRLSFVRSNVTIFARLIAVSIRS